MGDNCNQHVSVEASKTINLFLNLEQLRRHGCNGLEPASRKIP
jgi:hypothetical protein